MRRPEFIAKQGRHPSGILGSLLARVMASETAADNILALEFLEIQPTDHVLEIGYGHGRTIARAAEAACTGFVAGVDWSERMLRVATRYNRRLISEGSVELKLGASGTLPYPDRHFDKVLSVHTIYFWTNPVQDLREIARVMKPGARFVLGFRPRDDRTSTDFPEGIYRHCSPDEVRTLLEDSGFEDVRVVDRRLSRRAMCFTVARRVVSAEGL
jgi:SAM-dependent methyltransferase